MTLFACHIDEKPVPQGRARVGRWGTFYPKQSQAYRSLLVGLLMAEKGSLATLTGPLAVSIAIAGARATTDLDNHAKMVLDALQDAGVIASDDVRTVVELNLRVMGGEPATFISIARGTAIGTQDTDLEPDGQAAATPALPAVLATRRGRRVGGKSAIARV